MNARDTRIVLLELSLFIRMDHCGQQESNRLATARLSDTMQELMQEYLLRCPPF